MSSLRRGVRQEPVDQLLVEYPNANSERRCALIESLGESIDERVVLLFVSDLSDKSQDELVRVEILKALPFRNDNPEAWRQFGVIVSQLLIGPDDLLVRQYAACAMRAFIELDGVVRLLTEVIRDELEDSSVRHNALSSLERNVFRPPCRAALEGLVDIPGLGQSALRTLKRNPVSEPVQDQNRHFLAASDMSCRGAGSKGP
ncbi:MAG: hypothetical protein NT069_32585 [Planctomycetota bacterium]|nr:hypothetical protein [Planctomycetota bacterium]